MSKLATKEQIERVRGRAEPHPFDSQDDRDIAAVCDAAELAREAVELLRWSRNQFEESTLRYGQRMIERIDALLAEVQEKPNG